MSASGRLGRRRGDRRGHRCGFSHHLPRRTYLRCAHASRKGRRDARNGRACCHQARAADKLAHGHERRIDHIEHDVAELVVEVPNAEPFRRRSCENPLRLARAHLREILDVLVASAAETPTPGRRHGVPVLVTGAGNGDVFALHAKENAQKRRALQVQTEKNARAAASPAERSDTRATSATFRSLRELRRRRHLHPGNFR